MATLSTSYVDAVWSGNRKYAIVTNQDNTVSFTDETTYSIEGTYFGAADINATNIQVNGISGATTVTIATSDWSSSTTTINDKPYHTCTKTFTDIFTENPIVTIGASGTLPTDNEMDAYECIEAAVANVTSKTITFYCLTVPTSAVTVIVREAI